MASSRRPPARDRYSMWADRLKKRENFVKAKSADWNRYLGLYRMEPQANDAPSNNSVFVNFHFGLARVILPSIYYQNPEICIEPKNMTSPEQARIIQDLLNYQIEEINFQAEARSVVLDAFFCGIGVMKFGFGPSLRDLGKKPAKNGEFDSVLGDLFGVDPEEDFSEDSPSASTSRSKEPFEADQRVTNYAPFAVRVSPRYFYIDPLATCLENARWIAFGVLKTVEEVKANKRFRSAVTTGIEATRRITDEPSLNQDDGYTLDSNSATNPDPDLVMLYEVWDRESKKVLVMDEWNLSNGAGEDRFLLESDWPYELEGFPCQILVFNQIPDSPYGVSDAMVWHNPVMAYNELNTRNLIHARRSVRKYITRKGVFTDGEGEMDKLTDGQDMGVVQINGDPGADLQPLSDATLSPDVYNLREILRNDIVFISGVTEGRGVSASGPTDKTATQASIEESRAKVRDSDRVYLLSKFVERCVRTIHQIDCSVLTPADVAFFTKPEALILWKQQFGDIMRAEIGIVVRVGSSSYISKEVKVKQLIDFMNIAKEAIDPMTGMPVLNVREIISRIAVEMELPDPEKLLMPLMPFPPLGVVPGQTGGDPNSGGSSGASQKTNLRSGGSSLGSQLSSVQNLGVRRAPNPTQGD